MRALHQQSHLNLFKKLRELRQTFLQICRNDVPGLLAARTYGENLSETLRKALTEDGNYPREGWCVAAVGGFGRGELSFASDVDLLFIHEKKLSRELQEVIREFIYGFWDSGFEVGHATASISGLKKMVREEFSNLTNYLEARFLGGDEPLFLQWRKGFLADFGSLSRRRFLKHLLAYREGRLRHYGESSYLLEPHIKEGVGGLRDLHIIRWAGMVHLKDTSFSTLIAKEWLTRQEELWLEQAYDFLWRVRLQLHQLTGRRQDQLLFPEQEQVAARLGFLDGDQGAAVEAFMRLYYRHTARIRRTTSFFLERVEESERKVASTRIRSRILAGPFLLEGKHLHFLEPEWIQKDPRLIMRFFWQACRSGAHFHHQAGQIIRDNLWTFHDAARSDPEVVNQFFEILLDSHHAFSVLKVMLETRFLEVFIPEFVPIRYRVQHDVYHLYTVDNHLLRTVREMHLMERENGEALVRLNLGDIFVQVKNRRVLFLAALLHDIGKGQGKNHSIRGRDMVEGISRRLGLSDEENELLRFLIEHHLILAETALKRDLMDEKPVMKCAIVIRDRERLRMLYLLTIADSRATGPGAWNTWKASLLRELYVKVDRLLVRGDWKGDDLQERSAKVQAEVLELAASEEEKGKMSEWLDHLSFRYLLSQAPEAILEHYGMERELSRKPLVLHARRAEGEMWQITLATMDRPGLFSLIAGVLWIRGLNILSADIFTRDTGVALDILIVERLPDPLCHAELWEKVEADLLLSLKDRKHLQEFITAKRKPSILQKKGLPRKEDRIIIDEEGSDFYTIIEVYTWDRPGVLFAICNTLYEMEISIQLAKISTPGAQVADVFYVTDLSGNKLMDHELHEAIRKRLLDVLLGTL
ncbi:MAG: [protein-PII] uridylyltransferase [Deltaproteobacteria bacterium]|nr:[protein-PII] uridylyltransferase [Deltaproteobacteria bacterium]